MKGCKAMDILRGEVRWSGSIGFIAFILTLGATFIFEKPLDAFLSGFITLRSENMLVENMARTYALWGVALAINLTTRSRTTSDSLTGTAFLSYFIFLFLCESGMIEQRAQIICVFSSLIYLMTVLAISRLFAEFSWVGLSALIGSVGIIKDRVNEQQLALREGISGRMFEFMATNVREEACETIGIGVAFFGMLYACRNRLLQACKRSGAGIAIMAVCLLVMAFGAGYQSHEYGARHVRVAGLALTSVGLAGVIFSNQRMIAEQKGIEYESSFIFYLILYSISIILPAVFGEINLKTSLLLWIPCVMSLCIGLYFFGESRRKISCG